MLAGETVHCLSEPQDWELTGDTNWFTAQHLWSSQHCPRGPTIQQALKPNPWDTQVRTSWMGEQISKSQMLTRSTEWNIGISESQGQCTSPVQVTLEKTFKEKRLVGAKRCCTRKPRLSGVGSHHNGFLAQVSQSFSSTLQLHMP